MTIIFTIVSAIALIIGFGYLISAWDYLNRFKHASNYIALSSLKKQYLAMCVVHTFMSFVFISTGMTILGVIYQ